MTKKNNEQIVALIIIFIALEFIMQDIIWTI